MLAIRVKFVGGRTGKVAENELIVRLPNKASVGDLLAELEISGPEGHMISRNSELIDTTTVLRDGDCIFIHTLRQS